MRHPYPTRAGNTEVAWREHIIDVLRWKQERHGKAEFAGIVEDDLGARGRKVVEHLHANGVIDVAFEVEHLAAHNQGSRAFGRDGWVHGKRVERFVITAGPAFN
jgi:hypothetical protein